MWATKSHTISAFTFDTTTGALTEIAGSPYATGGTATGLVHDARGKFLYVANQDASGSIAAFTINLVSGALTPVAGSPFATGSLPVTLAVASY